MKTSSFFFSESFKRSLRTNIHSNPSLQLFSKQLVDQAAYWKQRTYDELYHMMFAPTIKRSHMVLSGGTCPSCKNDVHMYQWMIDPINRPWKLQCPHCQTLFPKNDFKAFYDSGLDEQGAFSYQKADRKHICNEEDGSMFGVDDGNGYTDENGNTYWFISTYLVYGQWFGLIVDGIERLANAYTVTDDIEYAKRALILLDRVADFFPLFDYHEQGIMYEEHKTSRGYVSYWGTSNYDLFKMAIAYDQIFEVLQDDPSIVSFLHQKAVIHRNPNQKTTFQEIAHGIETRIFEDALQHIDKFRTEYTKLAVTLLLCHFVLGSEKGSSEADRLVDQVLTLCTTIDGVIGQKGSYVNITTQYIMEMLSMLGQNENYRITDFIERYPVIGDSFKFHIDTWCLERFYPGHGDDGRLGTHAHPCYNCSHRFPQQLFGLRTDLIHWHLYKKFKDPAFLQALYISNGRTVDGLFENDFHIKAPIEYQNEVSAVIRRHGDTIAQESTDKKHFKMAILHSGKGKNKRAVYLDYDSGGMHAHEDALHVEIFAKNMHFMPDFGYPPVNCGGWSGKKFDWYKMPASHNLVVVDGKRHRCDTIKNDTLNSYVPMHGKTILWGMAHDVKAICAAAPEYTQTEQSDRLLVLIDLNDEDFYIFDCCRTVGGKDHARFIRNGFSSMTTDGLKTVPTGDYGHGTFMRNFAYDDHPKKVWSVDFLCDQRNPIVPEGRTFHLTYTSATKNAHVYTAESMICEASGLQKDHPLHAQSWIPTVMERVTGKDDQTASTFTGIFETHEQNPAVDSVRRSDITDENNRIVSDMNVALEVRSGRRCDIIISKSFYEKAPVIYVGKHEVKNDLCVIRTVDGKFVSRIEFDYEKTRLSK